MIETWFPTPIYYADLNPSDKDSAMMTQYLINFHQDKFSNLAKPGEDFTETASLISLEMYMVIIRLHHKNLSSG